MGFRSALQEGQSKLSSPRAISLLQQKQVLGNNIYKIKFFTAFRYLFIFLTGRALKLQSKQCADIIGYIRIFRDVKMVKFFKSRR